MVSISELADSILDSTSVLSNSILVSKAKKTKLLLIKKMLIY
jgi:hypothetical protein